MRHMQVWLIRDWLAWALRRLGFAIGWLGLIAIGAILFVYVWSEQALDEKKNALLNLQTQLNQKQVQHVESVPVQNELAPQQAFNAQALAMLTQLPTEGELPKIMATIQRLAKHNQILLNDGAYQWQRVQNGQSEHRVDRYEMRFMMQTDYVKTRHFISAILNQLPYVAITSVEMQREQIAQEALNVVITLTVFVRGRSIG